MEGAYRENDRRLSNKTGNQIDHKEEEMYKARISWQDLHVLRKSLVTWSYPTVRVYCGLQLDVGLDVGLYVGQKLQHIIIIMLKRSNREDVSSPTRHVATD